MVTQDPVLEPVAASEPVVEEEVTPPEPPTPEQLQARVVELEQLTSTHEEAVTKAKEEAAKAAKEEVAAHFQRTADQQVAAAKKEAGELAYRDYTFRGLQNLELQAQQGDLEAGEKLDKALRDPGTAEIWSWGHKMSQPPDVQQAVSEATLQQLTDIQAALEKSPVVGKLGVSKMFEIRQGTPMQERMPGYLVRLMEAAIDLAAEEKAQKLYDEKKGDHEEAVKSQVLEAEHAKAGGVAELKGTGGVGALTAARYKAMSPEERANLPPEQIDAMTRKYLQ